MRRFKLIHKIFLAMVVVFIIPTLSITVQSLHCTNEAVYDLQKDALYSQAVRVNQEISSWLLERVNDLKLWQEHQNLLTFLPPKHQQHSHWQQDASYEALFLYDQKGNLQKSFGIAHNEFGHLPEKLRNTLSQNEFSVIGNVHNHKDNHHSIHLGVAVPGMDGRVSYSIVVLNITQALQKIFIVDTQNYPYQISILANDTTDVLGQSFLDASNNFHWFSKNNNTIKTFIDNDQSERIGLSQKSPIKNWYVLMSADKQKTFNWIGILKQRIGLTAGVSIFIVLILGALLSWGVSRPFRAIIDHAQRISKGNTSANLNPTKDEEAIIVIDAINKMIETIKNKNIEIQNKTTLATVGELTASVVHEFRNPLSSIKMNLQAVKAYLKEEDMYSELTQIAFEQTMKLEKMLGELLTYGKPIDVELQNIKIKELIILLQKQTMMYGQNSEIEIEFCVEEAERSIEIDIQKIRSVVTNLVENSFHVLGGDEGKGTIQVEFHFAPISSALSITVKDTGPGIPENLLKELFLPFVTSRDEGTGLGLAIAMKFVKLHRGEINVYNQEHSGATFVISLPQNQQES